MSNYATTHQPVVRMPVGAPGPVHTKCGDWIEGGEPGEPDECKTCGPVPAEEVR